MFKENLAERIDLIQLISPWDKMSSSSVLLSVRTGRCPLPRWNSERLAELRNLDIRHNPRSSFISNMIARKDHFELISSVAKQDAAIFPQISTAEPHQPQTSNDMCGGTQSLRRHRLELTAVHRILFVNTQMFHSLRV